MSNPDDPAPKRELLVTSKGELEKVLYLKYCIYLYPGVGANYRWIKGKSVLTFVM